MECYKCKHRGTVPGSCHSSCKHPVVASDDPTIGLIAILASIGRCGPVVSPAALYLGIKLNEHGIKNGWCNFPWDFDPIWVDACKGFEVIEKTMEEK